MPYMRITRIHLKGYIPLTHKGIHELDLHLPTPVTVLLGVNGCGKSAVLRELTPEPALRPNYQKDGFKKIWITDGTVEYLLISDFKQQSPQSFLRDNIELNPGGTIDTQRDLIQYHFGYTPTINNLSFHQYHFSEMRGVERRNLLFSMYPSDLTFVYQHYKTVSSRVRELSSNLKMLMERKVQLEHKMIPEAELKTLEQTFEEYTQICQVIPQVLLMLQMDSDRYEQDPWYSEHKDRYVEDSHEKIHADVLALSSTVREEFRHRRIRCSIDHLPQRRTKALLTLESLIQNQTTLHHELESLKSEIDQYDHLFNDLQAHSIDELRATAQELKSKLEAIVLDPSIPVRTGDALQELVTTIKPEVILLMMKLHPYTGKIKTQKELEQRSLKKADLTSKLEQLAFLEENYHQRIRSDEDQLHRLKAQGYPEGCTMVCALKGTIEGNILELTKNIRIHTDLLAETAIAKQETERDLNALETDLQELYLARGLVDRLADILSRNSLLYFVSPELPLETLLNTNHGQIVQYLIRIIDNSTLYEQQVMLRKQWEEAELKIATLEKTNLPTADVLKNLLQTRTLKHGQLLSTYDTLLKDIERAEHDYRETDRVTIVHEQVMQLRDRLTNYMKFAQYRFHITYTADIRKVYSRILTDASTKCAEIKQQLTQQANLRARLHEEILPNIEKITADKNKLMMIEASLSPTSGIPHANMVRFINGLIDRVNRYIKLVWSYDLEVNLLPENEELDYLFPMTFNGSSSVSDISIGSKGQAAMIDLAFTLALLTYRKLGTQFPIRLDEIDANLSEGHRTKLITLLGTILQSGQFHQMFMVNHMASLYTSLLDSELVVLSPDGIVLPNSYNNHVIIK